MLTSDFTSNSKLESTENVTSYRVKEKNKYPQREMWNGLGLEDKCQRFAMKGREIRSHVMRRRLFQHLFILSIRSERSSFHREDSLRSYKWKRRLLSGSILAWSLQVPNKNKDVIKGGANHHQKICPIVFLFQKFSRLFTFSCFLSVFPKFHACHSFCLSFWFTIQARFEVQPWSRIPPEIFFPEVGRKSNKN